MAKNTKYLVAANGTFHLRNLDTGNSWCGRVRPGMEDVKGTNRESSASATSCGRCVQLNQRASGLTIVEKPAAVTKTVQAPTGTKKVRRAPVRALQGTGSATVKSVLALKDVDASVYDDLETWLAKNDIGSRVNRDLANVRLTFDAAGYTYDVIASQWNANGPGEGWVIQYNEDPSSSDPEFVDDKLRTVMDVASWLKKDLGLKVPFVKSRTVKPTEPVSNPTADVSSDLMNIMSSADHAYVSARKAEAPKESVDAIKALKKAAMDLHKIFTAK
jgi:hypothetical protein